MPSRTWVLATVPNRLTKFAAVARSDGYACEVRVPSRRTLPRSQAGSARNAPAQFSIRDHCIHIDDGAFDPEGDYPSSEAAVQELLRSAFRAPKTSRPNEAPGASVIGTSRSY